MDPKGTVEKTKKEPTLKEKKKIDKHDAKKAKKKLDETPESEKPLAADK